MLKNTSLVNLHYTTYTILYKIYYLYDFNIHIQDNDSRYIVSDEYPSGSHKSVQTHKSCIITGVKNEKWDINSAGLNNLIQQRFPCFYLSNKGAGLKFFLVSLRRMV